MNNYCSVKDNLFKANEQWIIFAVINPTQFFRQTTLNYMYTSRTVRTFHWPFAINLKSIARTECSEMQNDDQNFQHSIAYQFCGTRIAIHNPLKCEYEMQGSGVSFLIEFPQQRFAFYSKRKLTIVNKVSTYHWATEQCSAVQWMNVKFVEISLHFKLHAQNYIT